MLNNIDPIKKDDRCSDNNSSLTAGVPVTHSRAGKGNPVRPQPRSSQVFHPAEVSGGLAGRLENPAGSWPSLEWVNHPSSGADKLQATHTIIVGNYEESLLVRSESDAIPAASSFNGPASLMIPLCSSWCVVVAEQQSV